MAQAKGRGGPVARIARQQVHAAEQPILHEIQQERAANLAKARQQMGFAKAAAAIMQQAAPHVQQGYTNAANADAGYARGLGDTVQAPIAANTQAHNAFLANMGTPQGALQAAPPVGDLAYGSHGYIPATSLQREGAAWGAAAQLAPGNMLHQGQQMAATTLGNDPNLTSLQNDLARVAATQPEVYQRILAQLQGERDRRISLGQSQQRIGLEAQSLQLRAQEQAQMAAYRQVSLQMQQERITIARRKDNAAVARAIQDGKAPDATLSKVYGYIVDQHGRPVLNHGRKIPVKASSSTTMSFEDAMKAQIAKNNGAGAPMKGPGVLLPSGLKFKPTHDTDGLLGYPAIDIFGKAGTKVRAPESGTITRVHLIPWDQSQRVGGYTCYLVTSTGTYFLTHFGGIIPKEGARVKAGQVIGWVGDSRGWWAPHIHEGYHEGPEGPVGPNTG